MRAGLLSFPFSPEILWPCHTSKVSFLPESSLLPSLLSVQETFTDILKVITQINLEAAHVGISTKDQKRNESEP
jgi:hypothetical protein